MPDPDDEVEQRLTINDEGRVWFSGYNFGRNGESYEKARSKNFKIEKTATDRLLLCNCSLFCNEYDGIFTDIGNWEMKLTNTEGTAYKFRGSLCSDFDYEGINLSDLVRDIVGMDDLYLDGNCKPDDKQNCIGLSQSYKNKASGSARRCDLGICYMGLQSI